MSSTNRSTITQNPSSIQNTNTTNQSPLIIGVCGGTGSGKTSVCNKLIDLLGKKLHFFSLGFLTE